MFRVQREGALKSIPAGGGAVPEAAMITPRAITFRRAGPVEIGSAGQSATQIIELSNKPASSTHSASVLVLGESDHPDSGHFDDQARELFSKGKAQYTYFGDRKELEKRLSSKKQLIF